MLVRRGIAFFFIILGLCLLAYPTVRSRYFDYRQQQLLAMWDEFNSSRSQPASSASQEGISGQDEQIGTSGGPSTEESGSSSHHDPALEQFILENMEGVLTIKKIDLKIPVLKEDTEENLNISVAHVAGTSGPGEAGNYVIAGHRMRAYGRHFNRLHEVAVDDEIQFTGLEGETYVYRVFEVLVVNPEDTWVLQPSGEDKLITLVTCDYSQKPSVRLIVRGKLVEEGAAHDGPR
jgi:sortase A